MVKEVNVAVGAKGIIEKLQGFFAVLGRAILGKGVEVYDRVVSRALHL